jgi:hypothetical protein
MYVDNIFLITHDMATNKCINALALSYSYSSLTIENNSLANYQSSLSKDSSQSEN